MFQIRNHSTDRTNRISFCVKCYFRQGIFTELLQDILENSGELKERVPYEELVTTTFAEKAAH